MNSDIVQVIDFLYFDAGNKQNMKLPLSKVFAELFTKSDPPEALKK